MTELINNINDNIDNSGDESDQTEANFLKNNFILDDYLKSTETRSILEQLHEWNVEKKCDPQIVDFYKREIRTTANCLASLFAYDRGGHHAGTLTGIVFNNIEPKYDLTIFYDYPYLAQGLIEDKEGMKKREEEERLQRQRELYLATQNAGKKFNWATKTYM